MRSPAGDRFVFLVSPTAPPKCNTKSPWRTGAAQLQAANALFPAYHLPTVRERAFEHYAGELDAGDAVSTET